MAEDAVEDAQVSALDREGHESSQGPLEFFAAIREGQVGKLRGGDASTLNGIGAYRSDLCRSGVSRNHS